MSFHVLSSITPYILTLAGLATLISVLIKYFLSSRSQHVTGSKFVQDLKSTTRALPSSWYRSNEIYELERRAIFSKKWILVSHKLRFPETGSRVEFQEAGFHFLLIKSKQGSIQGFHSKNEDGHSAKPLRPNSPKDFNELTKELSPIHIRVDAKGFIWVNLDTSKRPEDWSAEFRNIDNMARHESFNFEDYHFDHTWGMSGDYNWKTLADNYNECYHCKTAHPDAAAVADLSAYRVDTKGGNIEHFANTTAEAEKSGLKIVSNYYFPNACMTVSPNFFYLMRCVPTSASHCSMEYEVYRHKDASDEDFKTIDEMFKRILAEDKWLCNNAQKNLNAGVFVNGEMHPKLEQGPLYFQHRIREQNWYQQDVRRNSENFIG
ncbi:cytochrome p450 oxidoreductase [Fusarium flagelliforme]|uniref:Choline monooxygenase, chloroplastic n=1 Tax=Fusarium flagelliforme TaxID=2675880 RepID=A0A395N0J6_9HYPO|nr:cytochrome p450 oxidoreductase [Fusarium flagelliforme]